MKTPTQMKRSLALSQGMSRRRRIGHRHGHGVLRRSEHLHGLLRALDRHLVEHHGVGLDEQIRCDHRQQRGEAVLVVGERVRERPLRRRTARTDDEIDVRDLVAVADQRLADTRSLRLARCEAADLGRSRRRFPRGGVAGAAGFASAPVLAPPPKLPPDLPPRFWRCVLSAARGNR